mgnify:CR=1 FL=1
MWLEIYGHQGEGIGGAATFEGWQVLILNYLPRLAPRTVMDLQRHTETDEMFILCQGRAILFLAGDGDEPGDSLEAAALEQGKVYRVRRNVWHTQVMTPEAKLFLVENRDTVAENSPRRPIGASLREQIAQAADRLWAPPC